MKIFICTSKHIYHRVPEIKEELERTGHEITLPNSYEDPHKEDRLREQNKDSCNEWKAGMFRLQGKKVDMNDAVLILNYEKHGQQNYIGGATFLEMFKAFELGKKIFLINPVPENMLKDEIEAMQPIILNGDLSKIK